MDDNRDVKTHAESAEAQSKGNPTAREIWHDKINAGSRQEESQTSYYGTAPLQTGRRRKNAFIIFGCILAGIFVLAVIIALAGGNVSRSYDLSGASNVKDDHIGILYIEGTIGSSDDQYSQEYVMDAVNGMMENDHNRGLMLYVNTPGGSVYESDELYLKIKEYQETTGRPVYAYFASQATSGGYYISASADRIIANRNCWTGSIGVTIGTLYDISGLLEKYGIKTETITSGANKAMGDITSALTDEQRSIFQGLVDESYDQFVSIVADGRKLSEEYVRSIADGRIYTAKQAEELKLVDEITDTYESAIDQMLSETMLYDCEIYVFRYVPEFGLLESLIKSADKMAEAFSDSSDISAIEDMLENGDRVPLQYLCVEKE